MALPATDSFTRSDSSDLGTNWDVIYGDGHQIIDNQCACNTGYGGGWDGAEIWNADSFNNDQYSQATVAGTMGTGGATGLLVRGSETDNYYGYYAHSTTGWLFKVVGGSWTTEGTGNSWSVSDEVYLEANGTTITAKKNGSNDSSVSSPWTDSDLSSGSAGVSGYGEGSTMGYLDDWEGGNLGAAPAGDSLASLAGQLQKKRFQNMLVR